MKKNHFLIFLLTLFLLSFGMGYCGAIHTAVKKNDLEGVKKALRLNPASVNYPEDRKKGWTPVHLAAQRGRTEVLKILLRYRPNVNARDNLQDYTPLHYAANGGHYKCVKLLIEAKAKVNAKNKQGKTPLYYASGETAQLLKKHGGKK